MSNNPELKVTGIKPNLPNLPRYTPTLFAGMAPYPIGMFVRHCDHIQVAEAYEKQYSKAVKHTEVTKEQLERMTEIKEMYAKEYTIGLRRLLKLNSYIENIKSKVVVVIAIMTTLTMLMVMSIVTIHYS